jgi:hypothetical protein
MQYTLCNKPLEKKGQKHAISALYMVCEAIFYPVKATQANLERTGHPALKQGMPKYIRAILSNGAQHLFILFNTNNDKIMVSCPRGSPLSLINEVKPKAAKAPDVKEPDLKQLNARPNTANRDAPRHNQLWTTGPVMVNGFSLSPEQLPRRMGLVQLIAIKPLWRWKSLRKLNFQGSDPSS